MMELTLSRSKKNADRIEMLKTNNRYRQGKFHPYNVDKYMGNVENIIFRSSFELQAFEFCDDNANIIKWASEEISIPYNKPLFNSRNETRVSKYYPDLYVEYYNNKGHIVCEMIEIKPLKQIRPSKAKKTVNRLHEDSIFIVNQHKWAAAEEWCRARNIRFRLMTENDLFK